MRLGIRMLRFFFPHDEVQRMELRKRIAHASASAEDLSRTVILDGDAIKAAIALFRSANDPQQVIQFDTFATICQDRGPKMGGEQLCRHESAQPGQKCEQHACPVIMGRKCEAQREVA